MIAIINIDPKPRDTGKHLYQLQINHSIICKFTHYREDGLAVCLWKAAMAAFGKQLKENIDARIELGIENKIIKDGKRIKDDFISQL